MTILESPRAITTPDQPPGQVLSFARDELGQVVNNPRLSPQAFDACMVDYLNAYQAMNFSDGQSYNKSITDIAIGVKNEVQLILGESIESTYDIEPRLSGYMDDEVAHDLRTQKLDRLPRAVSLTLIDLIDMYRPANLS